MITFASVVECWNAALEEGGDVLDRFVSLLRASGEDTTGETAQTILARHIFSGTCLTSNKCGYASISLSTARDSCGQLVHGGFMFNLDVFEAEPTEEARCEAVKARVLQNIGRLLTQLELNVFSSGVHIRPYRIAVTVSPVPLLSMCYNVEVRRPQPAYTRPQPPRGPLTLPSGLCTVRSPRVCVWEAETSELIRRGYG